MHSLIIRCLFYGVLIAVATSPLSPSKSSIDEIDLHTIEGKIVFLPGEDALGDVRILVDEGQYVGIPRVDGTFVISGVPSGSYVVSVNSPFHIFEPVRVDINLNGKIRARAVDFIQPGKVVPRKYPLHFETFSKPNYFQKREVYRLTDIIFSPMLLLRSAPIILLVFLPKLIPQPGEMQELFRQNNHILQPNLNWPDIADWFAQWFGGPIRRRPTNE